MQDPGQNPPPQGNGAPTQRAPYNGQYPQTTAALVSAFERATGIAVAPNATLKPFKELQPPQIDMAHLGDDQDAADMLREAGLL